jgi:hypothetical protein
LNSFGGARTVIVKINPADVVSIPSDYNATKGRACRYEVVGEIDQDKADAAFTRPVQSNSSNYNKPVKEGDTVFKKGYTDGYTGNQYVNAYNYGSKQYKDYSEGYDMGLKDSKAGTPERYRYVAGLQSGAWPFAKN